MGVVITLTPAYSTVGTRTNHPEDYAEYLKGCDIASFDIYPACHEHRDVAGKLWLVGDGVTRLRKWSGDRELVWNCIESTLTLPGLPGRTKAGVIGEGRKVDVRDGAFTDPFEPWEVHLYKVSGG